MRQPMGEIPQDNLGGAGVGSRGCEGGGCGEGSTDTKNL